MNLAFSQKFAEGSPTFFKEKIWSSYFLDDDVEIFDYDLDAYKQSNSDVNLFKPKRHSIRRGHRWHEGMKIHPIYNNRTKNRLQFAPTLKCKGVQDVFMTFRNGLEMSIDDVWIYRTFWEEIAQNDGFDSVDQFENWFIKDIAKNGYFSGQIIHWTNLRY